MNTETSSVSGVATARSGTPSRSKSATRSPPSDGSARNWGLGNCGPARTRSGDSGRRVARLMIRIQLRADGMVIETLHAVDGEASGTLGGIYAGPVPPTTPRTVPLVGDSPGRRRVVPVERLR